MKRFLIPTSLLIVAFTLSACANTSSRVQRTDYFSGLSISMPIGAAK
ncbi:hypothetical protein WJT86_09495 [Microvirga sp. W0021]|uniref:Lipoprotein n=1 Tax=Hohaiivirga grylli TaxID=3133970 RepID=A0ABV0BKK1_9HYPH